MLWSDLNFISKLIFNLQFPATHNMKALSINLWEEAVLGALEQYIFDQPYLIGQPRLLFEHRLSYLISAFHL